MRICSGFEMVDIAGEYIIVPIGDKSESIQGVFVVNEAVAFLLGKIKAGKGREELVDLLVEGYDVNREKAREDITKLLESLKKMGLISE